MRGTILLMLALGCAAVVGAPAIAAPPPPPADRAEVVRQIYAAFNARDRAGVRALVADDVIWHSNGSDGPAGAGPTRGADAFIDNAFGYAPNFKVWTVTPLVVLTDGKVVMSRQRDDVVRNDGGAESYFFNNFYEFNDKNQIKEVWELTSSAPTFH